MNDLVARFSEESDPDVGAEPDETERSHQAPPAQTTSMGGHGQESWHGGFDLPVPGQAGQQQDYVHQQNYPGPHTERELPLDASEEDGEHDG